MPAARFEGDAREFFEEASPQTQSDALPVLEFLSHGFSITSFREQKPRIWTALIKPNEAISNQFGLTLEYFLVGHGFPGDFHQRTLLAEPPAKEAYRVDSRLRFVASPSPLLKPSCAAWAVQRKLAVVPIEVGRLQGVTDPEKLLYSTLAATLWRRDVFDDPEPVTNPAEFFGRELVTNEIVEKILLGQPCAIFGLRKIGKSSLIRRVRDLLVGDPSTLTISALLLCNAARIKSGRWTAALVDLLEQWSRAVNEAASAAALKTEVRGLKLPSLLASGKPVPTDAAVAEAFEKDVDKILRAARSVSGTMGTTTRLVAFFDEADQLYPIRQDAGHWKSDYFSLWDTLQSMKRGLDNPGELVYILGGVNPVGTEAGSFSGRPNPLFELSTLFLPPLPNNEAEELLSGLGARSGLMFDESALDRAYEITGGHPWLLRKLGSKIHRADQTRAAVKNVGEAEVNRIFQRTRRTFFSHVDWILNHLKDVAPEEFKLLKDIAQGGEERYWAEWKDESFRETFAAHLEAYGLLLFDDEVPRISIELVRAALIEPIAQVFPEQKMQLREIADSLEATIRIRLINDLTAGRTVAEAVDAIVANIPKDAKNRPKNREQLREIGVGAGVRALVESLNWGDYLLLLARHADEIAWSATGGSVDEKIQALNEAVALLHLARHSNDAELKKVIESQGFEAVYRQVRYANEILIT
jgi:hypothetical protein